MIKKRKRRANVAAGNDEFLKAKATPDDIKKGNYTKVISLSYDEVDPS